MTVDDELRAAAFSWLREQIDPATSIVLRTGMMEGFEHAGRRYTLMSQKGIWKPRGFEVPLSITTTTNGPYDDTFTDDGLLAYRYQGSDPWSADNVGLREAMRTRSPLVYFHGIVPGRYVPVFPVFVVDDHPEQLSCLVAIETAYRQIDGRDMPPIATSASDSTLSVRRYVVAVTRRRLHQTAFREQVVGAYGRTCSMCRLRHVELLDAAHIIPDTEPRGEPVVPNGLCLCKIHHAAYDHNIIGVSPDYQLEVREDVRGEEDGPMLHHGLQGLHHSRLVTPARRSDRPDPDRLSWRYEVFRSAS